MAKSNGKNTASATAEETAKSPGLSMTETTATPAFEGRSIALLEIGNLTPSLMVADLCTKTASVRIINIESADSAAQCIKLIGSTADVRHAAEAGVALAERMGTTSTYTILPAPLDETLALASRPAQYNPLLDLYDARVPQGDRMDNSKAIGLLETQGLVAALHATDNMLKAANVELVGKEKIGAAYVTIVVRGDVAAVQAAIDNGRKTVEQLGGKLILADVIPRPHPDLAALLPK